MAVSWFLGAEGTKVPLREAGVTVLEPGQSGAEALLLGWTKDFGAADLAAAAQALWSGVPLYATSIAPYFASAKGRMLGMSGAMAAALHNATGVAPVVFGKPQTAGLDLITALTGVAAADMAVSGDGPNRAILMARRPTRPPRCGHADRIDR